MKVSIWNISITAVFPDFGFDVGQKCCGGPYTLDA